MAAMEWLHAWPMLLAAVIFLARVVDVSLGTLRTILIVRGYRLPAAAIGFCEVLLWLLAAAQVLRHLDHWYLAAAYAAGFATGNYVGIWLEGKLALGLDLVRAISSDRAVRLAPALRTAGHSVIELEGRGGDSDPVEVLYLVARRRQLPQLMELIRRTDPGAICTVTDVKRHEDPLVAPAQRRRAFLGGLTPSKRK